MRLATFNVQNLRLRERQGNPVLKEYWHFDYGNASWALEKGEEQSIYDIIKA